MARATQTTTTVKTVSIKPKRSSNTMVCNVCKGTGIQQKPYSKKKKK